MNDNTKDDKIHTNVKTIILVAVLLILSMPYILTRQSIFGFHFNDKTGVIGDTIGGITAPIVGLLGAYLVYLGFRQQIKTNHKQFKELRNQREESIKSSNYSQLKDLISLTNITMNKIVCEVEGNKLVGKELFDSLLTSHNSNHYLEKISEHIDLDAYSTHTLDFSHQAVLISKYYSETEKFKLSELGKEIIIEELITMTQLISNIIITTKKLSKFNNSYNSIIGTLERNNSRINKRIPPAHERIELD
ncbi:MAG: hypothetical protein ABJQ39_06840 [Winogradskyella arenosi]